MLFMLHKRIKRPVLEVSVPGEEESVSPEPETPRDVADVEKWIVQARAGNRDALGRLLDTCRHYLLLISGQELAPALRAKVAPSDIVQDSLLEAGRDFPCFRGETEEELLGWLRSILRNNVANTHRHFEADKREVAREIALGDGAADALLHGARQQTETPSVQVRAREQDQQLQRAMQRLSEHYRQILLLHAAEGLTFVQIAEKLGSTADAVRKQWGRAVEELAKQLDAPHESP
jgi:RNA polymerase sigma-70 factor, ECF subfamily